MSRLERALTELGGDIEVALEEIRVPAALVDRSGTVPWLNQAGRREAGDRTGEDVTSVIGPGAREQTEALLAKVLSRGEPTEGRLPVRVADGSFVVREISARRRDCRRRLRTGPAIQRVVERRCDRCVCGPDTKTATSSEPARGGQVDAADLSRIGRQPHHRAQPRREPDGRARGPHPASGRHHRERCGDD